MTTRLATAEDLPALTALFEERDGVRYPQPAVATRLAGLDPARGSTIVALVDGRIAGMSTLVHRRFGTAKQPRDAAYWTDLYVSPRHRGDSLYLPLTRATLTRGAESGRLVMTATRRREVWTGHLKLGFRISSAVPTRARPVAALAAVARIATLPGLAPFVAPFDAAASDLIDRFRGRPRSAIEVRRAPLDADGLALCLARLESERGRALGTRHDPASFAARFAPDLDGRPYELLVARRGGAVLGAAIVRAAKRDRLECMVVLELFEGGDPEVFHALAAAIEAHARTTNCDLVLVLDGVAHQSPLWEEAGYPTTPEWYVLLVAPGETVLERGLGDGSSWRFPFAEHDAF